MKTMNRVAAALAFALCILTHSGCATTDTKATEQKQAKQSGPARTPSVDAAELPDAKSPEILPDTHMSAGRLHESQGHLARAVDQYGQVVALAPNNLEAHNRLGMCLDRLGRFKEADDAFAKAIQRAPDQAYLHNNLAFSYIMQARWADAEAELGQALEKRPDFPRARVNLAMVYAQQERFTESLTQFQLALPKEDAWYNIGLMYQSKHHLTDAAKAFKTALEQNPKMVAARKRLEQLPPEVVSAVKETFDVTASPAPKVVATAPAAEKMIRPTTQPAVILPQRAAIEEPKDQRIARVPVPAPELVKKAAPAPDPVKKTTPAPELVKKATPAPELVKKTTPAPESVKKTTPAAEPVKKTTPAPEPVKKATPAPEAATHVTNAPEFGPVAETPLAPVADLPCREAEEAPIPQIVLAQLPEFKPSIFELPVQLPDHPDCDEADDNDQPDPENTWWHNAEVFAAP